MKPVASANEEAIEAWGGSSTMPRVEALGGSVVHPGDAWAVCKDSEGSPFGLALKAGAD